MKKTNCSSEYTAYLKSVKSNKRKIILYQILVLVLFVLIWEMAAHLNVIDVFLTSKPSDIFKLFIKYSSNGEIFKHVGISVYETILGFILGTLG
ncbi:MAG: ABC transporter permease, partial [Peptostreptococcaceae bacterium]|nr:ABC transporter permease [Peptostreptococcaceae bacterium]